MKFNIEKNELLKLLKFSDRIINDNRNNIINPILSFLYLKISNKESTVTCSNGITSGLYVINKDKLEIKEEGVILVKPKLLLNIIAKLKEDRIEFNKVDSSVLTIKTSSFSAQINIIDENSYPSISFDNTNFKNLKLTSSIINKINQKVSWAALVAGEQTKILNGIFFDTTTIKNCLSVVATDSYKLAYLCEPISTDEEFKFVLDQNILKIVSDLTKSEGEEKELDFYLDYLNNYKNVLIHCENMYFLNKTIEGNYPTSVYNAFNIRVNTDIKVSKYEFISALERGLIFVSSDKNPMVTLLINENGMNVEFMSYELGSSEENVALNNFEGQEIKVSLNAHFLISLLKAIEQNDITIHLESNTKPVIIYNDSDATFKELVLPMRTN